MRTYSKVHEAVRDIHESLEERVWTLRRLYARHGMLYTLAGGAPIAAPVSHPFGPPTIVGGDFTVDMMLQQPTRVTRMISDLSLYSFIADRIFSSPGGVSGGAVVYDQATMNELWTTRDVERVAPGTEFPIVTSERGAPNVAEVEKWGGKVWISDEAKDRNDSAAFANQIRQLTNTIIRKINARTVGVLDAAITSFSQTYAGHSWGAVVTGGSSQTNHVGWPANDFMKAQMLADQMELGVNIDTFILNPADMFALNSIYGDKLPGLVSALGASLSSSMRVTAGAMYAAAGKQVGEMRVEKPLGSETWREPKTERTWVQASVRPIQYVTNPYAILKSTGLT